MSKLPNHIIEKIKQTAKLLPVVLTNTHEKHLLTGAELLELNTITEVEGEKINPEKKYMLPMQVQLYWNHYRRLKKAYQKNGVAGIKAYCQKVETIIKNNSNE